MLNVPVAFVMGTAPLKFTPPSKIDQFNSIGAHRRDDVRSWCEVLRIQRPRHHGNQAAQQHFDKSHGCSLTGHNTPVHGASVFLITRLSLLRLAETTALLHWQK